MLRDRARRVLEWLAGCEGSKATNPYWTMHFWARVAASEESEGAFPDELRRVLAAYGYVGRATRTLPRSRRLFHSHPTDFGLGSCAQFSFQF